MQRLGVRLPVANMNWFLGIFAVAQSLPEYSRNIGFDGPFKDCSDNAPRRLMANESYPTANISFYHGVASGEPTDSDLLIWTRVTPPFQDEYAMDRNETFNETELSDLKSRYYILSVQWAISASADSINFNCNNTTCGSTLTSVDIDYTVKVIVDGLASDMWYHYQFKVGNTTSDIGRTRTIPSNHSKVSSWKFAYSSCKQFAHGFFNNLGDIAEREDLDMMLWLGDYIYEFPNDPLVNGSSIGRIPFPNNYLYNLSHYRGRYLSHHLDDDVKAAHQALPWYIVWDDHEVVNDYWKSGASDRWQDDSLFGVDFDERRLNGYQAFFEWTPTRTLDVDSRGGLYRSFRIGDLLDLIMIDSRSQRTELRHDFFGHFDPLKGTTNLVMDPYELRPVDNLTFAESLTADEHYAMGEVQREWFLNKLNESQTTGIGWRILGSNDVFGQSPPEVFDGDLIFGEDKWEGYPAERQLIIDSMINNGITNIVSLAGGPHMGIAQKVYSTGEPIWNDTSSYPVFTEFTLDALSAPKLFEEEDMVPYIDEYADQWSWVSPYFRLLVDGYGVMDITKERVMVELWINNNTKSQDTVSTLDVALCIYDGIVDFAECVETEGITTTNNGEGGLEEKASDLFIIIAIAIGLAAVLLLVGIGFALGCVMARKKRGDDGRGRPTHVQQASPTSVEELTSGALNEDNRL